jgi:hypothetical protein
VDRRGSFGDIENVERFHRRASLALPKIASISDVVTVEDDRDKMEL